MKDSTSILIRPRITEKATKVSESSVYVFEISKMADKNSVEKAFREKYKLNPVKVRTVAIPAKQVFVRNKSGSKPGYKKAYVYLKKGDKLETL